MKRSSAGHLTAAMSRVAQRSSVFWILAHVPVRSYVTADELPFPKLRVGVTPDTLTGREALVSVAMLVEAASGEDAQDAVMQAYDGASIGFCSPKPAGWKPDLVQWPADDSPISREQESALA